MDCRAGMAMWLIASSLVVYGCSDSGGTITDPVEGASTLSEEPPIEETPILDPEELAKEKKRLVHEQVLRETEPPGLVDEWVAERLWRGEPAEMTVDIFLIDDFEIDPFEEGVAHGEISEGRLIEGVLNEESAEDDRFLEYSVVVGEHLQHRLQEEREYNLARWHSLFERIGHVLPIDPCGISLRVTLPLTAVKRMVDARGYEVVSSITAPFRNEEADTLDSALESVRVSTHAHPNGWTGYNVGVWMNDGDGKPRHKDHECIDTKDLTLQDVGTEPFETHATQTMCTLMGTAPDAHVHFAVPTQSCNLRCDVDTFKEPRVYVSSQSNMFGDGNDSYSPCSRDWDNFVYKTKIAHFASAGNGSAHVVGAAKAYNVFAIGAYDDARNPARMAGFSDFGDPETGASKPDFVAPGVSLDVGDWSRISGTSFAAPIAAGFTADLMQQYPFLRYQPALLKAYLMVNAVRIDGTELIGDRDGAGRLDFRNTEFGRWYWWSGKNGEVFTSDYDDNGRKDVAVKYDLRAGQTYHVATSWLVSGNYVRRYKKPNMDIDLRVIAPNGAAWASQSVTNNFEMVRFRAPVSGTYTFVIERYWNSGIGDVSLGLAIRAR